MLLNARKISNSADRTTLTCRISDLPFLITCDVLSTRLRFMWLIISDYPNTSCEQIVLLSASIADDLG